MFLFSVAIRILLFSLLTGISDITGEIFVGAWNMFVVYTNSVHSSQSLVIVLSTRTVESDFIAFPAPMVLLSMNTAMSSSVLSGIYTSSPLLFLCDLRLSRSSRSSQIRVFEPFR